MVIGLPSASRTTNYDNNNLTFEYLPNGWFPNSQCSFIYFSVVNVLNYILLISIRGLHSALSRSAGIHGVVRGSFLVTGRFRLGIMSHQTGIRGLLCARFYSHGLRVLSVVRVVRTEFWVKGSKYFHDGLWLLPNGPRFAKRGWEGGGSNQISRDFLLKQYTYSVQMFKK